MEKEVTFNTLNSVHALNVHNVLQRVLSDLAEQGLYPVPSVEMHKALYTQQRLERELSRDSTIALGAFNHGVLIGFLWANPSQGTLYLEWGAVDQQFRRRGVFLHLLRLLEEEARRRGYHKLWLYASRKNTPAINCYLMSGYAIEGVHARHFFDWDFITLGKILDASSGEMALEKAGRQNVISCSAN